jgi:hypothetical protein
MRKSRTPPRRETAEDRGISRAASEAPSDEDPLHPFTLLLPTLLPCRPRSAARRISLGKRLPENRRENSANGTKYSCVRRAAAQCGPAHCRIVITVPSGILLSFSSLSLFFSSSLVVLLTSADRNA